MTPAACQERNLSLSGVAWKPQDFPDPTECWVKKGTLSEDRLNMAGSQRKARLSWCLPVHEAPHHVQGESHEECWVRALLSDGSIHKYQQGNIRDPTPLQQ